MTQQSSFYGKWTRGLMALSTISPALALLGIKGIGEDVTICSKSTFQISCLVMSTLFGIILPWGLLERFNKKGTQKALEDVAVIEAGDHMIVYAVAVILPLWAGETSSNQELLATGCAFLLVWFLIASSNLHHANLYLRLRGYRFFSASPQQALPRASIDSFLILSRSDITGQKKNLFCSIIDGKLLVMRKIQPNMQSENQST